VDVLTNRHWIEGQFDGLITKSKKQSHPTNEFRPHWAGKCSRLIQLIQNGLVTESALEHRVQRIFDVGTDRHLRYGKYFEELGILKDTEKNMLVYIEPIVLVGRCDFIVVSPHSSDFLVELKTINSKGFGLLNHPQYDHFLQWNLYSGGLKISEGAILYENKDTQAMKVFPVIFDEIAFAKEIERFIEIHECNMVGKYVPVEEKCMSKWCQAKDYCKRLEKDNLNGGLSGLQGIS